MKRTLKTQDDIYVYKNYLIKHIFKNNLCVHNLYLKFV